MKQRANHHGIGPLDKILVLTLRGVIVAILLSIVTATHIHRWVSPYVEKGFSRFDALKDALRI